jgi:phosphopantothenate-cysteine ligase/phosphopantothenoylcysteine decarboxylase/phosphopantothenate--cysteine ligase
MAKLKRMLVTAGSTASPIDKVRIITNIFHGRTGEGIARAAAEEGWSVTLLTSSAGFNEATVPGGGSVRRVRFRTFDDLAMHMETKIVNEEFDAIVHSAAVSDFRVASVNVMGADGRLERLVAEGAAAAKIPSSHQCLYLQLTPTLKLIDCIRYPWGFQGKIVKFKLQVDMSDHELLEIARRSVVQSKADYIVANCLEWCREYAYIVDAAGGSTRVERVDLARELLRRL